MPKLPIHEPRWLHDFKGFIMRGNVVDLAVGIVIGAAFTTIVSSLVEDLINPIIGLLIGGIDFSNVFVVLSGERHASLEQTRQGGAAVLAVGKFINAIIKFLIVGLAVFWLLRLLTRLHLHPGDKKKEPSGPTPSEKLLTEIRDLLKLQAGQNIPPPPTTGG
jgi:large conductance mechanosensitive channel